MTDIAMFNNGEFELNIQPHPLDGFRVLAPGLAKALGFDSAKDLLRSIPETEKGWELSPTPGGVQRVSYLTEAGFYRALGQRQAARITDENIRAAVERFQTWVYGVVLPGIRMGGQPTVDLASITKADLARMVLASEEEKAVLTAALENAVPAIEYHDRYVIEDDVIVVAVWAQQFGLTGPQAYDLLVERNVAYRVCLGERWSQSKGRREKVYEYRPRSGRKSVGWLDLRPQNNAPRHHNGQLRQTLYVKQAHAIDLAKSLGLVPSGGAS